MPEIGGHAARGANAPAHRHHRGRGGRRRSGQVPARARERGVGAAARARRTSRASCAPMPSTSGSTPQLLVEEYKLALRAPGDQRPRRSAPRGGSRAAVLARRPPATPLWIGLALVAVVLLGAVRARPAADNDDSGVVGGEPRRRRAEDAARRRPRRRKRRGHDEGGGGGHGADRADRPGLRLPARRRREARARRRDPAARRSDADVPFAKVPPVARQRRGAPARQRQARTVPATTAGIGYDDRARGRSRGCSGSQRPSAAHERARGHRRHRDRGPDGPRHATATGPGWPSACASMGVDLRARS